MDSIDLGDEGFKANAMKEVLQGFLLYRKAAASCRGLKKLL